MIVNVHLIPHTHLDPMWKLTPDEYQKQCNMVTIYLAHCRFLLYVQILGSVIPSMMENSNRTFAWESMHFLHAFLSQHGSANICKSDLSNTILSSDDCVTYREAINILLERRQLEFVGGGWTAQDESLTSIFAALDDLSLGRRYITEHFGEEHLPTVGWFLDSFGHSSGTSGTLAGLGYRGQIFNRVSHHLKRQFKEHGPSFFWYRNQRNAKEFSIKRYTGQNRIYAEGGVEWEDGLWTLLLPEHYSSPPPLRLVESVEGRRKQQRPKRDLLLYYKTSARATRIYVSGLPTIGCEQEGQGDMEGVAHVLLLVGDDFSHRHADRSFFNIDGILAEFNKHSKINLRGSNSDGKSYVIQYSTPSRYFQSCAALYQSNAHISGRSMNSTLLTSVTQTEESKPRVSSPVHIAKGHLLPYSDNFVNDWTGFYGSRPLLKQRIR